MRIALLLLATFAVNFASAEIHIFGEATPQQKDIIIQTVQEVQRISVALAQPKFVWFVLQNEVKDIGADAEIHVNKINISKFSLNQSEEALRATVAHEYTHLVVAHSFVPPNETRTVAEILKDERAPQETKDKAREHQVYGELLADTMATILTRNPKEATQMILEVQAYLRTFPETVDFAERIFKDTPIELSGRDFSVSDQDPRWASYEPADMTYNRFNQIRSYLWHKELKNLPIGKESASFSKILKIFAEVYHDGGVDELARREGVAKSNAALIEYLNKKLNH